MQMKDFTYVHVQQKLTFPCMSNLMVRVTLSPTSMTPESMITTGWMEIFWLVNAVVGVFGHEDGSEN